MRLEHYEAYLKDAFVLEDESPGEAASASEVEAGELVARSTGRRFPIIGGIPRFVSASNYTDNFGLQWHRFRRTQLDSWNGMHLTADRLWENTRWRPEDLVGKSVLEVGSGAGRFTEILVGTGADVVSFDFSNAVDVNYESNRSPSLFLFQGDLYDLPLAKDRFDYVLCYGVLQHTPDPEKSFKLMLEYLKPGGRFSVDSYLRMTKPSPWSTPKYLWRPVTSKMDPELLLEVLRFYLPIWLPIDTVIRRIPKLGRYIAALTPVPCWNYIDMGFTYRQRLEWAIMDTFDALAPAYDFPQTREEIEQWCRLSPLTDVEVFYGSNGVVANGVRYGDAVAA